MNMRVVATLCFLTLLVGCATAGRDIRVSVKVDEKANLKGYKTYAWAVTMGALNDPEAVWVKPGFDMDAEARFLIDASMRQKGFTVTNENPDVKIFGLVLIDMDKQAAELRKTYGEKADISGLAEGALVVGLVDTQTAVPIWLAAARGPVKRDRTVAEGKARLAAAVQLIFQQMKR